MVRSTIALCAFLLWLSDPAKADVAFGLEYSQVEREIEDVKSDEGTAYSASISWDLKNSMFQLKHSEEESEFGLVNDFGRQEFSVSWFWNRTTRKQNYKGTAFGLFYTNYDVFGLVEEDFVGLMAGFMGTRYLISDNFFFSWQLWLKAPHSAAEEGSDLDDDQAKLLLGFEGQAGFGVAFGESANFAAILGVRRRSISFSDRFIVDDERTDVFLALRIFVPGD